jgi:hypothetical protein
MARSFGGQLVEPVSQSGDGLDSLLGPRPLGRQIGLQPFGAH